MIEKITPLKKNTKKIIKQDQFNVLTFNIPRREKKNLSEWMNEFFPPSLATILNVILPIWLIIQLFQIKQPHPLKVIPILLNLNKWYHHWPFFLSKSAQNTKWCVTPVKKDMRHLYLRMMIPTKTKMWTKFFFWLECWCVSQNNKRHFFDNQRKKKYIEKKNLIIFASLLLQISKFLAHSVSSVFLE